VLIAGPDANAGMQSFVTRLDGPDAPGTAEYVSAAVAHLGGSPTSDLDPTATASFGESLRIAADLQSDFRTARHA
jgi:hypothetical protein